MLSSIKVKDGIYKSSLFFLILTFLFLPFTLGGHNAAFTLTVLCAIASGAVWARKEIICKEPLVWALSILFILVCLGSMYSLSTWDAALGGNFNKYLKLFCGVFFVALLTHKKTRDYSFAAFYVGVFFVLLCTYANVWFNLPWSFTQNTGWGEDHTVFGNYITQNIMMSFFVLQNFFWFERTKKVSAKIFFAVMALLAVLSVLYLSNGRTGYLVLVGGMAAYLFFALPKRWAWASILAVVLVCGLALSTSERVQERYQLAKEETQLLFQQHEQGELPTFSSIGARWYMWIKSLELVQERPLTGWGLGSHGIKWCEKAPEPVWCQVGDTTPHNQFIFFAVELGVGGFLAFLFLLGVIFWSGWHGEKYRPIMMGFGVIFICDSLVNASLWNAREYNFFIIMMCLLYCMIRFRGEKE